MPTWVNVSVAIGTFLVALLAFVVSCLARESAKVAADAARRSRRLRVVDATRSAAPS